MSTRFSTTTLTAIYLRDGNTCQRCFQYLTPGQGIRSVQHRRPGAMGGGLRTHTTCVCNGVVLCGDGVRGCHGWVESNRSEALASGLLVRQTFEPYLVPLALPDGRYRWLECSGQEFFTGPAAPDLPASSLSEFALSRGPGG
jgi:hypothetical protein